MKRKKVQKNIRLDYNLDARIKECCEDLDISQTNYIKLCIQKDLAERKY